MRTLEELGIGRPSTYASILGTILDRGYVFKKGTALVPAFLAFSVVNLLKEHFGRLVDYGFTASMEDDLDRIASGDQDRLSWLNDFYFGAKDNKGLQELVSDLGGIDAREINSIEIGNDIVLRVGRYGPYLERDGQRANVPEDIVPDELTVEKAEELLAMPSGDRELGLTTRRTGARSSRAPVANYGPYVTETLEGGSKEKPRTASLFKSMSLDTITQDEALQLLSLPRVVGESEGEESDGAERPLRPVRPEGERSRARSRRRSSSSASRSTVRSRCSRRRASAGAAASRPRR